jgi:hypothetical protein
MSQEDELRQVLDETAREISGLYSNPRSWLSWIIYLLDRLEKEATYESAAYKESYMDMLVALQDQLRNRLKTGGW